MLLGALISGNRHHGLGSECAYNLAAFALGYMIGLLILYFIGLLIPN